MAPILGIYASSNYQRVTPDSGAMFPIAMVNVGSAGAASVVFSSIPQTYKHLQVRLFLQTNRTAASNDNILLKINDDTGASGNYTRHQLIGDGSSASAGASVGDQPLFINPTVSQASANNFSANIVDILDYTSTSKNKTLRILGGYDTNGGGAIAFYSGLYQQTTAISKLEFYMQSGTLWNQYTQVGLYGIKG